jgi:transcriptional regulator with XRE-family HTH domain
MLKNEQITKKMVKPVKSKIPDSVRAEAIIMLSNGESQRDIAEALGISLLTTNKINQSNSELIKQIKTKIADKRTDIQERIIFKSLEIIKMKLDEMSKDEKLRTEAKLTELSSTIKTIFDKTQLEAGKPTAISKTTHEDIETKRLELIKTARLIENGTTKDLIEAVIIED